MNTAKQRRTFISYSRQDNQFALELARELKSAGYLVWLDQLDIPAGARWDDEVERALHDCEIFLIILTPASVASENVKDEIGYAIDSGKRILPVLLEESVIPLRLRRFQYVDFTKMEFSEGIKRAEQLLQNLINEQSSPVPTIIIPENTPKTATTAVSSQPVEEKSLSQAWISRGAGILALTACLAVIGVMVIFRDLIFQSINNPQAQDSPAPIQTENVEPTLISPSPVVLTLTQVPPIETSTPPDAIVVSVSITPSICIPTGGADTVEVLDINPPVGTVLRIGQSYTFVERVKYQLVTRDNALLEISIYYWKDGSGLGRAVANEILVAKGCQILEITLPYDREDDYGQTSMRLATVLRVDNFTLLYDWGFSGDFPIVR